MAFEPSREGKDPAAPVLQGLDQREETAVDEVETYMTVTLGCVGLKVFAERNCLPGDGGFETPRAPSDDLHPVAVSVARRGVHLRIGPDRVVDQNLVHLAYRLYECGPILRRQIAQIDHVTRDGLAIVGYRNSFVRGRRHQRLRGVSETLQRHASQHVRQRPELTERQLGVCLICAQKTLNPAELHGRSADVHDLVGQRQHS